MWPHREWGGRQPAGWGSGEDCWGSPDKTPRWQQRCNESERPPGPTQQRKSVRLSHMYQNCFNTPAAEAFIRQLGSGLSPGWQWPPGCTDWTPGYPTLWSSSAATRSRSLQTSCHLVGYKGCISYIISECNLNNQSCRHLENMAFRRTSIRASFKVMLTFSSGCRLLWNIKNKHQKPWIVCVYIWLCTWSALSKPWTVAKGRYDRWSKVSVTLEDDSSTIMGAEFTISEKSSDEREINTEGD